MSKVITLSLNPIDANFDESINDFICKKLNSKNIKVENWKILKKSIDARKKNVKILLKIEVSQKKILKNQKIERNYKNVSNSEEVIIIGSGPAGLFAALTLLEKGKKPILFERGKMLEVEEEILLLLIKIMKLTLIQITVLEKEEQEPIQMVNYIPVQKKEDQ